MNLFYKKAILSICSVLLMSFILFAQSNNQPWRTLFNGTNLDGWKMVGSKGVAIVEDATIICHQTPNTKEHTFVCTNEKFKDFILEMDIKTDSNYNSGILLRSIDAPLNCDTCTVSLYGYQVKLDRQLKRRWTGGIFDDYGKTWHWLYSLENDERARNAHKIGDWNHFRMEAIGSSIKVWINDVPVTNMINDKYKEGYIAIKIHSALPGMEHLFGWYKNIRIITENPEKYVMQMDIPAREVH